MIKEERSKPEIIQSVADGDRMMLILSEVNEGAFRARASEINRQEGWQHYRIATNASMNTLMIIAEKRKEAGHGGKDGL